MTHEERLALIHRPFFITKLDPSYPWGGCAVTDTFYGTNEWATRTRGSKGDGSEPVGIVSSSGALMGLRAGDITKFNAAEGTLALALTLMDEIPAPDLDTDDPDRFGAGGERLRRSDRDALREAVADCTARGLTTTETAEFLRCPIHQVRGIRAALKRWGTKTDATTKAA